MRKCTILYLLYKKYKKMFFALCNDKGMQEVDKLSETAIMKSITDPQLTILINMPVKGPG